jgi:predicted O-methyltransferase YrrM
MAIGLPRLLPQRGVAARTIGRAVLSVILGRIPPEERDWSERIEHRRSELMQSGAVAEPFYPTLPSDVERASWVISLPPGWCTLLMRVVRELQPASSVELGTGFGISAAYQAAAMELDGGGELTTIEGSPEWARLAEEGLAELGLRNVSVLVGPIGATLPRTLDSSPFQYAFVDAEHNEAAMLADLDALLPYLSAEAVVAFDDIDANRGMRRAWAAIRRHRRVSAAVGLGRIGIAVITAERVGAHIGKNP